MDLEPLSPTPWSGDPGGPCQPLSLPVESKGVTNHTLDPRWVRRLITVRNRGRHIVESGSLTTGRGQGVPDETGPETQDTGSSFPWSRISPESCLRLGQFRPPPRTPHTHIDAPPLSTVHPWSSTGYKSKSTNRHTGTCSLNRKNPDPNGQKLNFQT